MALAVRHRYEQRHLTAHPSGERWHWESRNFAGAYDDAPAGHRPVYGALDS